MGASIGSAARVPFDLDHPLRLRPAAAIAKYNFSVPEERKS
jgi:hypothetical protein